jgi:hypothetical protein
LLRKDQVFVFLVERSCGLLLVGLVLFPGNVALPEIVHFIFLFPEPFNPFALQSVEEVPH